MPSQFDVYDSDFEFLCVETARGGTFAFAGPRIAGPAAFYFHEGGMIGTQFCHTCVGIFLRIDKHRSFVAHINAWSLSAPPLPRNYVDEAAGEKLRERMFRALQQEASQKRWDPADKLFAETIMACYPHPELSYQGQKVRVAGSYVIRGIRDYLAAEADTLSQIADNRFEGAKRISSIEGQTAEELLCRVQDSLSKGNDKNNRAEYNGAINEIKESIRLRNRASNLTRAAQFVVHRDPHGFIMEHRDGEVEVVRYLAGKPILAMEGLLVPEDLGGYSPREHPDFDANGPQNWDFHGTEDDKVYEILKRELDREYFFIDEMTGRPEEPESDSDVTRNEDDDPLWQPRVYQRDSGPWDRGRTAPRAVSEEPAGMRRWSGGLTSDARVEASSSKQSRVQSSSGVRGEKATARSENLTSRDCDVAAERQTRA